MGLVTLCAEFAEAELAGAPSQVASMRCAGVSPPPGLPPPLGLPSHGSCLHGTGACKPCVWFWKAAGCEHGEECLHCHLCPRGEIAARRNRRRKVRAAERDTLRCWESDISTAPPSETSASSEWSWSPLASP